VRLLGETVPREFTPPLRELTPETSAGPGVVSWARDRLGWDPMPWQEWWLLHALELREDGLPRFRTVLTQVSRQSGKSSLWDDALAPYFLCHGVPLIMATSASMDTAVEGWESCVEHAEDHEEVFGLIKVRRSSGQFELTAHATRRVVGMRMTTSGGCMYKLRAANRRGGRGPTVHRLHEDEIQEHRDWEAHAAADAATIAVPDAQTFLSGTAGDASSVVLWHFRDVAGRGTSPSIGYFGWTADDDADAADRAGWAQANPALGFTITEDVLAGKQESLPPRVFAAEHLCRVPRDGGQLGAVDVGAWGDMGEVGARFSAGGVVHAGVEVSEDHAHVSLVLAGPVPEGDRVRVVVAGGWGSVEVARRELPGLLAGVRPRTLSVPAGPAMAALGPTLRAAGARVVTSAALAEAAGGFVVAVLSRRVVHSQDPLLTTHVGRVVKVRSGAGFRFGPPAPGVHVDSAVAASLALAGAVADADRKASPLRMIAGGG
jgi:hypothetical protein